MYVLFAFLMLGGGIAHAQTDATREASENLARSARVAVDRNIAARIAAARELVAQNEFATAISSLQEILNRDHDAFVVENETYTSAKSAANRIIAKFPTGGSRLYEQQIGAEANSQFQQAVQTRSMILLAEVAVRFRNTNAGFDAIKNLAALAFDRGQFCEAASAYKDLLSHPRFQSPRDSATIVRLIIATLRCGQLAEAKSLYEQYRARLPGNPIRIGGELKEVQRWLANRLADNQQAGGNPSDWAIPRGNLARNRITTTTRPLSLAKWEFKTQIQAELQTVIADSLVELRDYGIADFTSHAPIVVGDTVVARTVDRLAAFDVKTGNVRWQRLFDNVWSQHGSNSQFLLNPNFRALVAESLSQQVQSDSVANSMSSDGIRLFVIEPTKKAATKRSFSRRGPPVIPPGGPPVSPAQNPTTSTNHITAIDLSNGKTVWNSASADSSSQTFFLGPPLPIGDTLYAVAQRGPEIVVDAIAAADGQRLWSIPLAISSESLSGNPRRRGNACPVAFADGMLICPTGAGIVVAVELMTRQVRWAYRYERTDSTVTQAAAIGRGQASVRQKWWNGWRDTAVVIDAGRVIVAPAESSRLLAFDVASGDLLWNQPRDDGLSILGTSNGKILIMEEYSVRARAIESGDEIWSAPIGKPAGRGFMHLTHCYIPLQRGGIASLSISNGAVKIAQPASKSPLGNLIPAEGGVISQSFGRIAFLPELASSLAAYKADSSGDDSQELVTRALVHREAGQLDETLGVLKQALQEQDEAAIRRKILDTLVKQLDADPAQWKNVLQQSTPFIDSPEERIQFLHATAIAAATAGDRVDALKLFMELSAMNPDADFMAQNGIHRVIRYDRLIQGQIAELSNAKDANAKKQIDDFMTQRRMAARDSLDPFATQRFASHFSQLKWGQRLLTEHFDKATVGVSFLKSQLRLHELADSSDEPTAAAATRALAQLYAARSFRTDAATHFRRLSREFAAFRFSDGKTGAEIVEGLADDSLVRAALESSSVSVWPNVVPTVTTIENKPQRSDVYFRTIQIDCAHGSLLDRITVGIHRTGESVRFQGDGQHGAWTLKLPDSKSPFRRYGHGLYRGWGIGHLLVLQVGTELFGIAPINDNGEPLAELLWSLNTLKDVRHAGIRTQRVRKGFGFDELLFVDDFDWTIGQIGPVRPGYIVYRERAKLVAIDPATGKKLWQRFDIPRESTISGDDAYIAIWQPEQQQVELLSVIDGSSQHARVLGITQSQVLFQQGRRWIVEDKSRDAHHIRCINVADESIAWQAQFPSGSVPFAVDLQTLGILQSNGVIDFLSRVSGKTLGTIETEIPAKLTQIRCAADEHRVYVVLSGPLSDPAKPAPQRAFGDYRNPWVNGTLYCLDRATFKLNWSQTVTDITFALDQPRDIPFLISSYRKQQKTDTGRTTIVSVIEFRDKRSGKPIFETTIDFQPVYTVLDPKPDKQQVDLHTPTRTFRLGY